MRLKLIVLFVTSVISLICLFMFFHLSDKSSSYTSKKQDKAFIIFCVTFSIIEIVLIITFFEAIWNYIMHHFFF